MDGAANTTCLLWFLGSTHNEQPAEGPGLDDKKSAVPYVGSGAWIRTTISSSKGRGPAVERRPKRSEG